VGLKRLRRVGRRHFSESGVLTFGELVYLINSDLYRQSKGRLGLGVLLRNLLRRAEFQYTFWLRLTGYLKEHRLWRYGWWRLAHVILRHYQYKYGILIPCQTRIGSGFYIVHFGGIVISARTVLGRNVSISPGVVIGRSVRGPRRGNAVIGDNVYIGPGAKVIGKVRVGDNVAIGANCVVTKDVPDKAVVVGVPGRVISYEGSAGYVQNIDYDRFLKRPDSKSGGLRRPGPGPGSGSLERPGPGTGSGPGAGAKPGPPEK